MFFLWILAASLGTLSLRHCATCFRPQLDRFSSVKLRTEVPESYSFSRYPKSSALFMSSKPTSNTLVVYQKVVKSPTDGSGNANPLFLGYLVEYLQETFELPDRMSMVYESVYSRGGDAGTSRNKEKFIQSWDSPMSPASEATRLDLEVVAIYKDGEEKSRYPSMAMVAVKKAATAGGSGMPSPMMQNLFDHSERQILNALDRGLDDFMAGRLLMDDNTATAEDRKGCFKAAQDALIEEMLEEAADSHPSVPKEEEQDKPFNLNSRVVDVEFSKVEEVSKSTICKRASGQKEMISKKKGRAKPVEAGNDFAIEAARVAAKNRAQREKQGSLDFAVAAAKKIAKENPEMKVVAKKSVEEEPKTQISKAKTVTKLVPRVAPTAVTESVRNPFRTTFSTPEMFAAKQNKKARAISAKTGFQDKHRLTKTSDVASKTGFAPMKEGTTSRAVEEITKKAPKRKLNLTVRDKNGKVLPKSKDQGVSRKMATATNDEGSTDSSDKKQKKRTTKTKDIIDGRNAQPTDEEIMKMAQKVIAEIAEQGIDMSAEEMLQDVLKFGEKQYQENRLGSGFVSGAFAKAKELLREQKSLREQLTHGKAAAQVAQDVVSKMDNSAGPQLKTRVMSPEEEELKQMFEAGERIADSRITVATVQKPAEIATDAEATAEEQQQEIDKLIAADKTVSDHARILDDELAELEMRIRETPGEELDGPPVGKHFDIFSGPEVYNPNVDPETAVNWPGALPGTKPNTDSILPKEMTEAVKQAKFALEVLQQMEVKESPIEGTKTIYAGSRELSQQQYDNLQNVVHEAVEVGLIPNPLVLMEERSRLQMLVEELWEQPEERVREILSNYKDLLLSDNFVSLMHERLEQMAERELESLRQRMDDDTQDHQLEKAHARERELLGQLVVNAQLLLTEVKALGAELEAQQIEVIRSICKVAMDPSHTSEEQTSAALTDAVRDMRPLFDDIFVSYLKYAIAEEEGSLARTGVLDDPDHNQWLFVLKIVQQGVRAEIAKGINRYIEHIWYVLRMKTAVERRLLLEKLVDSMPSLDVRPFVRVVDNIVGSLGEAAQGELEGASELGKMTNKLLQLHRDVKEILPPARINQMSRDADDWAAKRKELMLEQRRLTNKRLEAARETEEYDREIESLGRRGDIERFD